MELLGGDFFAHGVEIYCQLYGFILFVTNFTILMGSFVSIYSAVLCWLGSVVFVIPFINILVNPIAGQVVAGPELV